MTKSREDRMKKTRVIVADDSETKVSVTLKFNSLKGCFTRDELIKLREELTDLVHDALKQKYYVSQISIKK